MKCDLVNTIQYSTAHTFHIFFFFIFYKSIVNEADNFLYFILKENHQ